MSNPRLHQLAEERSLAIHRYIADRIASNPEIIERARARVEDWLETGSVSKKYAQEWKQILASPLDSIRAALVDPREHARALRQSSPFAGAVDPRTRWRIWDEVAREMGIQGDP